MTKNQAPAAASSLAQTPPQAPKAPSSLTSTVYLTIGQVLGTVLNFAFHIYASQRLTDSDYGAIGSLMTLFTIGSLPLGAVMLQVAYSTAQFRVTHDQEGFHAFVREEARRKSLQGAVCFLALTAASPLFMRFLHLPSIIPLVLLWMVLGFSLVSRLHYGIFQGMQEFRLMGLYLAAVPGLRLLFAVLVPKTLVGIMVAQMLPATLELAIGFLIIFNWRRLPEQEGELPQLSHVRLAFWYTVAGQLCLALMTNADMLLVRNRFPGQSGDYSILTQIARGIMFFPLSIAYVLFPRVSEKSLLKQDPRWSLIKALGVTAALVFVCSLPCILFPRMLAVNVFDPKYAGAADLLVWVGFAAGPLALVSILVHHLLAIRSKLFLKLFVPASFLHVGALMIWGASPLRMVLVMGGSGLVVSFLLLIMALRRE